MIIRIQGDAHYEVAGTVLTEVRTIDGDREDGVVGTVDEAIDAAATLVANRRRRARR